MARYQATQRTRAARKARTTGVSGVKQRSSETGDMKQHIARCDEVWRKY
jgi:hypothetical protein